MDGAACATTARVSGVAAYPSGTRCPYRCACTRSHTRCFARACCRGPSAKTSGRACPCCSHCGTCAQSPANASKGCARASAHATVEPVTSTSTGCAHT